MDTAPMTDEVKSTPVPAASEPVKPVLRPAVSLTVREWWQRKHPRAPWVRAGISRLRPWCLDPQQEETCVTEAEYDGAVQELLGLRLG